MDYDRLSNASNLAYHWLAQPKNQSGLHLISYFGSNLAIQDYVGLPREHLSKCECHALPTHKDDCCSIWGLSVAWISKIEPWIFANPPFQTSSKRGLALAKSQSWTCGQSIGNTLSQFHCRVNLGFWGRVVGQLAPNHPYCQQLTCQSDQGTLICQNGQWTYSNEGRFCS